MRLTANEVQTIKSAAVETFGQTAIVRLFGSRLDDTLVGGDLDLHVEADPIDDVDQRRFTMQRKLWRTLDYDKIDLLVSQRGGKPRGFERIAYRDGAIL